MLRKKFEGRSSREEGRTQMQIPRMVYAIKNVLIIY